MYYLIIKIFSLTVAVDATGSKYLNTTCLNLIYTEMKCIACVYTSYLLLKWMFKDLPSIKAIIQFYDAYGPNGI